MTTKYKQTLKRTQLDKIKKMVLVSAPSEKYKAEEIIQGRSFEEKQEKFLWIIERLFPEDFRELMAALEEGFGIAVYFFTETRKWLEEDANTSGKKFPIERTKVGYGLHRIYLLNSKNKVFETKKYKEVPLITP